MVTWRRKPGFYEHDVRLLSAWALSLMLIGYLLFVAGASVGQRLKVRAAPDHRDQALLIPVCLVLISISILNFLANVVLISGGNLIQYLGNFALRPYEIQDNAGVTAVGYLLGFIGVQVIAYLAGRAGASRRNLFLVLVAIAVMTVLRFSQGRIFQTLVLLGACYVSYAMGAASRCGQPVPWIRHIHFLVFAGIAGLGIYFLRLASALSYLGHTVSLDSAKTFGSSLVHFALERGNVPNFPIVLTILDKMPAEQDFLYGSSLFNWLLFFIPKSILKGDYLISIWIKETWYMDIEGGGLPPTAVGEWYANFGVGGVVVGMFLIGLIMGVLYKRAAISSSPIASVLWANLAFGFVVIYPKTDLAQIPVFSIFIIGALWCLMLLLRSALRS